MNMTSVAARAGAIALGAGLFAALPGGSALADTNLTFCNKSGSTVDIALVYYEPKTSKWILSAWRSAPAGNCRSVGTYRSGLIYYYAEKAGGQAHWPSKAKVDKTFCVPRTRIERTILGGTCAPGERGVGFHGIDATGAKFTFNLNAD
jgi:uncharacterized membrane protein